MADRADAANARHERWHLIKRAALAEFLEPAELGDVEIGFLDVALLVQMERDFGVPLDAGHRVDHNGLPWHNLSEFGGRVGHPAFQQLAEHRENQINYAK